MTSHRIPRSGPFDLTTKTGLTVSVWYNREIRLWTLQLKDTEGNQIGPAYGGEAEYSHSRPEAVASAISYLDR